MDHNLICIVIIFIVKRIISPRDEWKKTLPFSMKWTRCIMICENEENNYSSEAFQIFCWILNVLFCIFHQMLFDAKDSPPFSFLWKSMRMISIQNHFCDHFFLPRTRLFILLTLSPMCLVWQKSLKIEWKLCMHL